MHGILVSEEDREHFLSTIRSFPQNIRGLWLESLARDRIRQESVVPPVPLPLSRIDTLHDLDEQWYGKTEIAIAERDRAFVMGMPEDDACIVSGRGIELVRFDLLHESATLRRLSLLSQSRVLSNTRREKVWNERFELVARHAKHVVICDRYAGLDLVRHYESDGENESGLRWVLHRLDLSSRSYVSLILAAGEGNQQDKVVQSVRRLASELKRRGVRDIKLSLALDRIFLLHGHDRHIRFDDHDYALGQGMKLFSEPLTAQISDCFFSEDEAAHTKEETLRKRAYLYDYIVPLP
ncbi:MAG: hypothetical protein ACR2JW_09745 [Thermomicrobiales bacterium]